MQLSNCTTVQLSNCPTVQLSNCPTVQLYNCTTVQLCNCTVIQLSNCATVQLYNCKIYCTTLLISNCNLYYNRNKFSIDVRLRIQIIQTKILLNFQSFPENFYFKFLGSRVRRNQSFVCYSTFKFKIQTTVIKSILYRRFFINTYTRL